MKKKRNLPKNEKKTVNVDELGPDAAATVVGAQTSKISPNVKSKKISLTKREIFQAKKLGGGGKAQGEDWGYDFE